MASSLHESQNQDSRITVSGTVGETMSLNTLNSGSHRSNHDELGNSFLAILSGPPSLLQYDFKQLSDPKPLSTFSTLPTNSSRVMIGAAGSGVPLTPIVPLTENLGNHNLRSGADLRAVVSSMEATSSNCSSLTVLRNDHQAANFYCQSQELAEALTHNTFPGVEKVRDVSSPRGGWPAATNAASSRKLHSTNVQVSQKMPSDRFASVSSQSSTFMSGCPRVSCLGKSGSLLLSNTGLLGVVCSCHCLHMSISKFCEHSGLVVVNPGDAVRLDSGQTIAQWRKLYFQKFGAAQQCLRMVDYVDELIVEGVWTAKEVIQARKERDYALPASGKAQELAQEKERREKAEAELEAASLGQQRQKTAATKNCLLLGGHPE